MILSILGTIANLIILVLYVSLTVTMFYLVAAGQAQRCGASEQADRLFRTAERWFWLEGILRRIWRMPKP